MPPRAIDAIATLPNMLTMLRVGAVPILVGMLYLPGSVWAYLTGLVFFLAGLTDLLDGFLARRMKQVSVLGQYLDPVADKLLVASIFVVLVDLHLVHAWMAIIIICREIGVTGMRAVAASRGFQVPSDLWGKGKTALQMLALLLLIMRYPVLGFDPLYWGQIVLWPAVLITIWSGLAYFKRFLHGLGNI